ncbi:MAG TPA: hypothetical protein VH186_06165 [Chloroflexia bacterium]|nr:hypothetical protein [Chloroflexia bacterium]
MKTRNQSSRPFQPAKWTWLELGGLALAFFLIVWPLVSLLVTTIFPPTVRGQSAFDVIKGASAGTGAVGDPIVYNISVTVNNPDTFTLSDTLPAQVNYVSSSCSAGCSFISGASVSGKTVSFLGFPGIPAGTVITVLISTVIANGATTGTSFSNTAIVDSNFVQYPSNSVSVTVSSTSNGNPTPTPAAPTATPTFSPPSPPASTVAATNTPVPTNTAIPPTNTAVPPTSTSTAVPPTNTAIPPTATAIVPTNTPVSGATNTPVPTNTSVAGPTQTPIRPTNTPIPPTNTPIPPTNTFVSSGQPTPVIFPTRISGTPGPAPTNTPGPTPTNSPNTPAPNSPPASTTQAPSTATGVISGSFMLNGNTTALSGSRVDLIKRAGGTDSIQASSLIDNTGQYSFLSVPVTGPGELYAVRFSNPGGVSSLRTWTSSVFTFGGGSAKAPSADLADVTLGTPGNSDTLFQLPLTLNWNSRFPGDTYSLIVYYTDGSGIALATNSLGGATSYTIQPNALANGDYFAEVTVSNNAGSGISQHQFRFRVGGQAPAPTATPSGNVQPPTTAAATTAPVTTAAPTASTGSTTAASTTAAATTAAGATTTAATTTAAATTAANTTAAATTAPASLGSNSTGNNNVVSAGTPTPLVSGVAGNSTASGDNGKLPTGTNSLPQSGGEMPVFGLVLAALTLVFRRLRLSRQRRLQP